LASLGLEFESKHLKRIIDSIASLIHAGRPDGDLDYFNQRWLEYTTKKGIPKSGMQNRPVIGIHSRTVLNMMGTAEHLHVV